MSLATAYSQALLSDLVYASLQSGLLDDPSGAQATVFKNSSTGEFTVAVRGTEPAAEDYVQDLLLAVGVPPSATPQFIALKGWLDGLFQPVPEGSVPEQHLPPASPSAAHTLEHGPGLA